MFHTVADVAQRGNLTARLQIHSRAYLSETPAQASIRQRVEVPAGTAGVVVSAWARIEQLFGTASSVAIRLRAAVERGGREVIAQTEHYAVHLAGWQLRQFTLCVEPAPVPTSVVVTCSLDGHRGAIYFDDVRVVPVPEATLRDLAHGG
eukprot:Unigene6885_Nuclearia_a/m.21101 Unigene6885_Nuclearia_a/g.21101  ORF Unigene6885_Nuclearia_a/g.21101 Unigene6885_Nuclearia_a/m.21101 type:complete len:149 (-) Unigene6885_Nuclearia_a:89-535(-)